MRSRVGWWLRRLADWIDPQDAVRNLRWANPPEFGDHRSGHGEPWIRPALGKGGYAAAAVPVSAMGPVPDVLTRPGLGQKSPRGTVRPPVITTQQETPPPPSVHTCCHRRDCTD